ncbi:MAG: Gfo/Idh/MocA family oxidoreductase, partial [Actinobacteria bacterium]
MDKPIRVAVIGLGYWGPNLARTFYELDESFLSVCADLDKSKLEELKTRYPVVNTTTDIEEIYSDPDLDAIVIAVPAAKHFKLAKAALLAGKHVFVEKPLALNSKNGEEV